MTDILFEHLAGITALILFIWSAVLVWASWQIGVMVRSIANERRELCRWKRLASLATRQRQTWE